jgi:hypothetical protein
MEAGITDRVYSTRDSLVHSALSKAYLICILAQQLNHIEKIK